MAKIAVLALGGNAILPKNSSGDIHSQFSRTRESVGAVIHLLKEGYDPVITHGNGPQAGNELIRNELGINRAGIPELPLGIIVAETEGWMGYMIEQSLQNILKKNGINREVVTVPTQVIVSKEDRAWENPTKPVGPFLTEEEASSLQKRGISVIEDSGRGFRRVVPSPKPLEIVEKHPIKLLLKNNTIVIAAGGGGMPVYRESDGTLEGLEGIIDKDFASAVLGKDVNADLLMILTAVPEVYINYKKENQKPLRKITIEEAEKYLEEGHFPPGSMGPKIKAGINFIRNGGEEVIITSVENVKSALRGKSGTRISRERVDFNG